jgi:hypothetical protein
MLIPLLRIGTDKATDWLYDHTVARWVFATMVGTAIALTGMELTCRIAIAMFVALHNLG